MNKHENLYLDAFFKNISYSTELNPENEGKISIKCLHLYGVAYMHQIKAAQFCTGLKALSAVECSDSVGRL